MAATGKTALKAKFETGDIPTQTDFENLIDSSPNIVDDAIMVGFQNTFICNVAGTQADGTPITKLVTQSYSNASDGDSCTFPPLVLGNLPIFVNASNKYLKIFPAVGENFINQSANDFFLMNPYTVYTFGVIDGEIVVLTFTPYNLSNRVYTEWIGKLTQSGTADPVAVVVSNSLGAIAWTRSSAGSYQGLLVNGFLDQDKVVLFAGSVEDTNFIALEYGNADSVHVNTIDVAQTQTDGILTDTSIHIRVYQ